MRERLVIAFVGLTVGVLALLAVAGSYTTADLVQDQHRETAERAASLVASVVQSRTEAGETVDASLLESLLEDGESVRLTSADGGEITAGDPQAAGGDGNNAVVTEHLASGGTLVLTRSGAAADERLSAELLTFVLLVLALALIAGVLALLLASRLARPFRQLTEATEDFSGSGLAPELPTYSIPEAERLRLALSGAVLRVQTYVERERAVAVQASHELRTPITALRLSLEDLTLWKQTPPEVSEELQRSIGELDRLSRAVDELLDRRDADTLDFDLAALVRQGVQDWKARTEIRQPEITVTSDGVVAACLEVAGVLEVLNAMLRDAVEHGAGPVTVDVRRQDSVLHVAVCEPGPARFSPGQIHRDDHGVGERLAAAAQIAESLGGHLRVDDAVHQRLTLVLPGPDSASTTD